MKWWLERNAKAIQAFAALATLLLTLAALVGIKMQIDASAQIQREQSARDIYREFLSLSLTHPQYASPDYCAMTGQQILAYENYVEYLLYAGEQMLDASTEWEPTLSRAMQPHRKYLCSERGLADDDPQQLRAFLQDFSARECAGWKEQCPAG